MNQIIQTAQGPSSRHLQQLNGTIYISICHHFGKIKTIWNDIENKIWTKSTRPEPTH